MTLRELLVHNLRLKLLALAAALLLWLFAGLGRDATVSVQAPVELSNLSPTLQLASPAPAAVEVTLAGPRIRMSALRGGDIRLRLDLAAAGEGTVAFSALHRLVEAPAGVDAVRVQPAAIELRIVRKAGA